MMVCGLARVQGKKRELRVLAEFQRMQGDRMEKGTGWMPAANGPPNLASESVFPQLGGRRTSFVSQNLDVQRAEKLTYHQVSKDRLAFTKEYVAEAK